MVITRSEQAAKDIVRNARARPWGLAVAAIADGKVHIELDPGADSLSEASLFQIGSVTKTMTGLLLAHSVIAEEVALSTRIGAVLGEDAGVAANVTLLDLATQTSGLPRLPPNLDTSSVDPQDPYAEYTEKNLLGALKSIDPPMPGEYEYSNFGFMLLGVLLEHITGQSYAELIASRVFEPLGMLASSCGVPESGDVVPGYRGATPVPWWQLQLPGPGGVASSIRDMATYVSAFIDPPPSMRDAIELSLAEHAATPEPGGLAWAVQASCHWHNGGTGGFHSFVALHRESQTGVAVLANSGDAEVIDGVGFNVLAELAQAGSR